MKFIIIGCGRMGSGLAHNLSLLGHDLTVVDRDPDALRRLGPGFRSCYERAEVSLAEYQFENKRTWKAMAEAPERPAQPSLRRGRPS